MSSDNQWVFMLCPDCGCTNVWVNEDGETITQSEYDALDLKMEVTNET